MFERQAGLNKNAVPLPVQLVINYEPHLRFVKCLCFTCKVLHAHDRAFEASETRP